MPDLKAPPPVTVHMVGNAHIDPVWLWPMSEGRAEMLSTYRTALMLLDEFEGYVFTSGGAVTYKWVSEDDPAMFRAIQQAVAQGRWALVNGWWLQPDCNIPSGESFVRHALYGQRYLLKHFGQRATVGYNVDTFGHAGTLPQLLSKAGLDSYVFFRPGPHEKQLPNGPFWWEAPDGSRVLTCRPPLHYGTPADVDILKRAQDAAASAPEGVYLVMCFYGVGNHGGGPTRRIVRLLAEADYNQADHRAIFSTPARYFAEVKHLHDWPVVKDELQHHSRGCYTALSRVKRENRQAEHALARAERLSALASLACAAPNRQAELEDAWHGVLFNQFHDILAGTSIREAYEDVWQHYDHALSVAARVENAALEALEEELDIPERAEARPFVVWNPLAWERTEAVQLSIDLAHWRADRVGVHYPSQPSIVDADGNAIPCQLAEVVFDHSTYVAHIFALVSVPALGAKTLYVTIPVQEPPAEDKPTQYATELDNGHLRIQVDPDTGWLVSLWDVEHNQELLGGPAALPLVIDDPSDTWSHDVVSFRQACGRFVASGPIELLEDGAVRKTLRVRSQWGHSTIVQDFSLHAGARYVDVTMTVDWRERHKMLKLAFPLDMRDGVVTASAPYGHIVRQANGEEEPCQAWVDLSSAGQTGKGLCLVNDSKYGYEALDGELRLSILRSPIYAFHQPRQLFPGVTYLYTDQGEQVVRYRLFPHGGDWRAVNPALQDDALHEPLKARPISPRAGRWSPGSLLRAMPDNFALTTVKLAEEDGALIIRGYETLGEPAQVEIRSDLLKASWSIAVGAHEVCTWRLPLDGGQPTPLNLLEEALT
jgi:alpha-mannosidase